MHDGFEAVDALGAVVKAGDHAVGFAAGFHEDLFSFFFDLFEGFEAVAEKGGAEDGEAFDAVVGHGAEGFVGVGFEPFVEFVGTETGLEGEGPAVVGEAGSFDDGVGGGEALLAVADGVGVGVGDVAAVVAL